MKEIRGAIYKIETFDEKEKKMALPIYFIIDMFDARKVIEYIHEFTTLRIMSITPVNNFSLDKILIDVIQEVL